MVAALCRLKRGMSAAHQPTHRESEEQLVGQRAFALALGLAWAFPVAGLCAEPGAAGAGAEVRRAIEALCGPNAVADWQAGRTLVAAGDAATPALEKLAGSPGPLAPRLVAVELLGEIGSKAAMDALLNLLPREKDLAVRGQICMQLGYAREKRAVPVIGEWLRAAGPRSLDDRGVPKESEPSTCYARHCEALGMIGDESAIPALQEFLKKLSQGIGGGGWIASFVGNAAKEAIQEIQERSAFWKAVREHPGLEEKLGHLFRYLRPGRLTRFGLYDDEIVRGTEEGKAMLQRLTAHRDGRSGHRLPYVWISH